MVTRQDKHDNLGRHSATSRFPWERFTVVNQRTYIIWCLTRKLRLHSDFRLHCFIFQWKLKRKTNFKAPHILKLSDKSCEIQRIKYMIFQSLVCWGDYICYKMTIQNKLMNSILYVDHSSLCNVTIVILSFILKPDDHLTFQNLVEYS